MYKECKDNLCDHCVMTVTPGEQVNRPLYTFEHTKNIAIFYNILTSKKKFSTVNLYNPLHLHSRQCSLIINPCQARDVSGITSLQPTVQGLQYRAMSIGSIEINTSLLMMRECKYFDLHKEIYNLLTSHGSRICPNRTNRDISETALPITETKKRKHFAIESTPQNLGKLTSETTFGHSKVVFQPLLRTKRTITFQALNARFKRQRFQN